MANKKNFFLEANSACIYTSVFDYFMGCIKEQIISKNAAWKALQFTYNCVFHSSTFYQHNELKFERLVFVSAKTTLVWYKMDSFLLISFFSTWWYLFKVKQKTSRDAAWKALQSAEDRLFLLYIFCFQRKQVPVPFPSNESYFSTQREILFYLSQM